jgi:UDP-glucose 4-epimerase
MEVFTSNLGEHFIFSSSCATYGDPQADFIGESCPQNPVNPYGFTKLAGEKLIMQLETLFPFNYSILRYFNVAGADPALELGEIHSDEPHLIPRLISAAKNGEKIQVFGDDYDTPDGTAIRDFIHVSDLALAHYVALRRSIANRENLIANLGSGNGYSVLEIASSLKKFFPGLELEFSDRRPGDPTRLVSKTELDEIEFAWKPRYSKIEQILDSAINWDNLISRHK